MCSLVPYQQDNASERIGTSLRASIDNDVHDDGDGRDSDGDEGVGEEAGDASPSVPAPVELERLVPRGGVRVPHVHEMTSVVDSSFHAISSLTDVGNNHAERSIKQGQSTGPADTGSRRGGGSSVGGSASNHDDEKEELGGHGSRRGNTVLPRPIREYETALLQLRQTADRAAELYRELIGVSSRALSMEVGNEAVRTTPTAETPEGSVAVVTTSTVLDGRQAEDAPGEEFGHGRLDGDSIALNNHEQETEEGGIDDGNSAMLERAGSVLEAYREGFASVSSVLSIMATGENLLSSTTDECLGRKIGLAWDTEASPVNTSDPTAVLSQNNGPSTGGPSGERGALKRSGPTERLEDGSVGWPGGWGKVQDALKVSANENNGRGAGVEADVGRGQASASDSGEALAVGGRTGVRKDEVPPEIMGMLHRYSEQMLRVMQVGQLVAAGMNSDRNVALLPDPPLRCLHEQRACESALSIILASPAPSFQPRPELFRHANY